MKTDYFRITIGNGLPKWQKGRNKGLFEQEGKEYCNQDAHEAGFQPFCMLSGHSG